MVVLQTVAANLGSVLTPVGNPQNLYLYSRYHLSMAEFFSATLPLWLISLAVVLLLSLRLSRSMWRCFWVKSRSWTRRASAYTCCFLHCVWQWCCGSSAGM